MTIRVCHKCKSKEIIEELKKLENIDLKIECIQFCGIGRNKYIAIIDHIPIIKDTKEELLEEIKLKIKS